MPKMPCKLSDTFLPLSPTPATLINTITLGSPPPITARVTILQVQVRLRLDLVAALKPLMHDSKARPLQGLSSFKLQQRRENKALLPKPTDSLAIPQ